VGDDGGPGYNSAARGGVRIEGPCVALAALAAPDSAARQRLG
jgi:hypothetical protein